MEVLKTKLKTLLRCYAFGCRFLEPEKKTYKDFQVNTRIMPFNETLLNQVLYLRGHDTRLQALDSIAAPRPIDAQSRPPLDGAGLLHDRYLCINPPPHVTSQSDQSLHGAYPPSSANHNNKTHIDKEEGGRYEAWSSTFDFPKGIQPITFLSVSDLGLT